MLYRILVPSLIKTDWINTRYNVLRYFLQCYQLEKREIPYEVSWIHSLPSPGDQNSIWSLSAQWDILQEHV
jgi:hypothetical protein